MAPKPPLERLKTGVLSRSLALTKLTVNVGARAAGQAVSNLFASKEGRAERTRRQLLAHVEVLAAELGQLKGSVMKAGQMLSMYGEQFLPPEANALLKSLQSHSPPLAWERIAGQLQAELGAARLADVEIDHDALAAASMGQVHGATRRRDQARLAIKVQYPGVEAAIQADLRVLRRLLSLARLLPRRFDQAGVFAEIQEMLIQEADYTQELAQTQWFADALRDDPRYLVPEPIPELSTHRVLTTRFEANASIDSPEVAALSQERRNALGSAALDLYMRELWSFGRVQTDPHFGNYGVRLGRDGAPDRLVVFDFGAVRIVPPTYLDGYRDLVTGACRHDAEQIRLGGTRLGLLTDDADAPTSALFVELCVMITEPFRAPDAASAALFDEQGFYDWGRSDLPRRLARRGAQVAFQIKLQAPPRESLFLDRKLGGMFILLAALKVRLDGRAILRRYLPIDALPQSSR